MFKVRLFLIWIHSFWMKGLYMTKDRSWLLVQELRFKLSFVTKIIALFFYSQVQLVREIKATTVSWLLMKSAIFFLEKKLKSLVLWIIWFNIIICFFFYYFRPASIRAACVQLGPDQTPARRMRPPFRRIVRDLVRKTSRRMSRRMRTSDRWTRECRTLLLECWVFWLGWLGGTCPGTSGSRDLVVPRTAGLSSLFLPLLFSLNRFHSLLFPRLFLPPSLSSILLFHLTTFPLPLPPLSVLHPLPVTTHSPLLCPPVLQPLSLSLPLSIRNRFLLQRLPTNQPKLKSLGRWTEAVWIDLPAIVHFPVGEGEWGPALAKSRSAEQSSTWRLPGEGSHTNLFLSS